MSKPEFKVIVAGSRDITDYKLLCEVMVASNAAFKATEIVSGGAKGVDELAERWAREHKVKLTVMKAKWNDLDVPGAVIEVRQGDYDGYYNSKAGLMRNEDMAAYADALVSIHCNTPGSLHMIQCMKRLLKPAFIKVVAKPKAKVVKPHE